jgi:O-antigen/teichoic acid export membrane protein
MGLTLANFARLAGAAVVAQAVPLLALPVLARLFSPAEIGAWTLFGAIVANLATFACGRYEYAIVLPRTSSLARLVLQLCFAVTLGVSLLSLVFAGAVSLRPVGMLGGWIAWLPLAVLGAGAMQALTLWHNRMGQFGAIGAARIAGPVTVTGLQVAAGWGQFGVFGLVAAQAAGSLIGPLLLAGWRSTASALGQVRAPVRRLLAVARRYRQFPLINAPHAFINSLQDTLTLVLLAALAGQASAGYFGLMGRIAKAPASLIGGALSEILLGRLADLKARDEDLRPLVRRSALYLALTAFPLAAMLVAAGPALFGLLLGSEWSVAGEYARWFAPYLFGHFVIGPLTITAMVIGCQREAFLLSFAGNAAYLVVMGLAIWLGGDVPVACGAVSVAMCVYFSIYWRWLMRRLEQLRRDASGG